MRPRASVPVAASAAIAAALAMAATPAWAAPATVVVKNHDFNPSPVTVNAGDAVTWDFQEGGHNVVSYEGPSSFDSRSGGGKTNSSGTKFTTTLTKPGVYKYLCTEHGSMLAEVDVQPAPATSNGGGNTGNAGSTPTTSGSTQQPTTTTSPSAGANPVAPSGSLGAVDAAAPSVRSLGVKNGRLALKMSEDGRLVVRYVKAGAHGHVVHKRIVRAHKGTVRLSLRRWMKSGRYRVHVMAYDAAGNASRPVRVSAVVR